MLVYERGLYSPPYTSTDSRYQSGYFQDSWTFGRFTLKPGVRFEQQSLIGNQTHYILSHNWAPRLGLIVDPFNNHKTKIDASFGRFFEHVPADISVRALSSQLSITGSVVCGPRAGPAAELVAQQLRAGRKYRIPGRLRIVYRERRPRNRRAVPG